MIEVRLLGPSDSLARAAPGVFDDPLDEHSTRSFLADPRHRLAVAIDDDLTIGFASAVIYLHPDKTGPEMWINEIAVAPSHRRQGIARRLIHEMLDEARAQGCAEAWVLTERSNTPAMSLYESLGGIEDHPGTTMFTFHL